MAETIAKSWEVTDCYNNLLAGMARAGQVSGAVLSEDSSMALALSLYP